MRVLCGVCKVGVINIPSQLALGRLRPHFFLRSVLQLTMVTGERESSLQSHAHG